MSSISQFVGVKHHELESFVMVDLVSFAELSQAKDRVIYFQLQFEIEII